MGRRQRYKPLDTDEQFRIYVSRPYLARGPNGARFVPGGAGKNLASFGKGEEKERKRGDFGSRCIAFGATWVAPPPRWRFAPLMTKAAVLSGASFDMNNPRSNSASEGPKVPRRTRKRVPFLLEKKRRGGWLPRGVSDSKNFAFRPP